MRVKIISLVVGSYIERLIEIERGWYHSRNKAGSEDSFIRNG